MAAMRRGSSSSSKRPSGPELVKRCDNLITERYNLPIHFDCVELCCCVAAISDGNSLREIQMQTKYGRQKYGISRQIYCTIFQ